MPRSEAEPAKAAPAGKTPPLRWSARLRAVAPELRWYEINNGGPEPLFACRAGAAAPPPNGAEKLPLLGYSSEVAAPDWTLLPEVVVVKVLQQQLSLLSHSLSALEQTHRLFSSALVQAEAARRIQLRERARDQGARASSDSNLRLRESATRALTFQKSPSP